jgi:colanic acid biosynthesis glycosyl transferase WcaI
MTGIPFQPSPRPLHILIVGLNYAPEEVGIGPYTSGLAEALAARGHRIEVVSGKPYYPQWKVNSAYTGISWPRSEKAGVSVTHCPHYVPLNPTGLRRIIHLASFALSALPPVLHRVLRRRSSRPEIVLCIAPALFSVITAWLGARLGGAKLWIHLQDFEVEAALATGLLDPSGVAARLARWIEARILALADRVSTISPQMCAKLADKGIARGHILELRNWSDARFSADPVGAATIRAEWALGKRQVALYSGNIARKQGIEILLEAARLLVHRKDLILVICGEGPNRAELERLAAGLDNIQLHDLQPVARMGAMLTMASVHLLPQIAGAADLVLPSKLTNMLASGRPVVATAEPETGLYDEVVGCGTVCPPGDPRALAAAIEALLDDPVRRAQLGKAATRRAAERWAKDPIIDRFAIELDRLTR